MVNKDDDAALWHCRLAMDSGFDKVASELEAAGANPTTWVQRFPPLRKSLLKLHLDSSSENLLQAIGGHDSAVLEALNAASVRIAERNAGDTDLDQEQLNDIKKQLESLSQDLEKFEPGLRDLALELIESLRHAISVYQIRGVEAFEEVLARCIGELYLVIKASANRQLGVFSSSSASV